ncbi:RAxF-45 family protein [Paenibacillus sp. 481]|uniref:RAxF-45 family protein n=1 Tax=Paenibacillus sp. 481 TaxID=2835869 RepID=UPI001E4040CC|nr:RAxF-45 family protein [Paenibacillus sp. 481]UHA75528.1 hypothetical protein KIK04_11345 [Paenibacillus sp. 481]
MEQTQRNLNPNRIHQLNLDLFVICHDVAVNGTSLSIFSNTNGTTIQNYSNCEMTILP